MTHHEFVYYAVSTRCYHIYPLPGLVPDVTIATLWTLLLQLTNQLGMQREKN